jgi:acyl carrier protein
VEVVQTACQRISGWKGPGSIDAFHRLDTDLGMDALHRVDLFLSLEEYFNVEFPSLDASDELTVAQVAGCVINALKAKGTVIARSRRVEYYR